MVKIIKYQDLGNSDYGWLNAHYHFSFARYVDRDRMGFGVLRVINDDIIAANHGFDPHPHDNMEIITYVRKGAITHGDNQGNQGRTEAGDVQVMSAGSGIFHSEANMDDEETNLYQIWITPNKRNVKPRWDQMQFPKEPVTDKLNLIVSGNENDDALFIHQDAMIFAGRLSKGTTLKHVMQKPAYILVSQGRVTVNDQTMEKGDGAEAREIETLNITAQDESEILIIEVPQH